MKRRISEDIAAWRANPKRKPLMMFGARQTGKTTSVLAFGKKAYEDILDIDFFRDPEAKAAFSGSLRPDALFSALSIITGHDIVPGRTLVFLDEVQECDEAITALKFLQPSVTGVDVIAAGSLLGVHVARSGSFPVGYVDMLTMRPMSFEEYCWAMGEARALELVETSYAALSPCPVHGHMLALYRDYLMVGGMPEAVSSYSQEHDLRVVRKTQSNISTAYVADMAKYATVPDAEKVVACWDSIPAQLAKELDESKKFKWGAVASGARASRYASAVDWLVASGVVNRCNQVTDGVSPLKSFENPSSFKLYMADTGLLSCAYGARPVDLDGTDRRSARFRGALAENYVMQQLVSSGITPYYWGVASRGEVEFVIADEGTVVPVEVKSKSHVRSRSAISFAEKYGTGEVVRVSAKNFGHEADIRSVPLYAAHLIGR